MNVGEKIKAIRKAKGLSQEAFGVPVGLTKSHISGVESGSKNISPKAQKVMIAHYNVSSSWWETEKGEMFEAQKASRLTVGEFATVKVYSSISCGAGVNPGGYEEIGLVSVPARYDRPNIIMVRARGRSMESTIKDGGYVGIDTSDRNVVSGEMYAVCSQIEGAVVKRLVVKDDCLELVSDNLAFKSTEVRDVPDYFVIGRVRLVVNEY